eukprot:IDg2412t1
MEKDHISKISELLAEATYGKNINAGRKRAKANKLIYEKPPRVPDRYVNDNMAVPMEDHTTDNHRFKPTRICEIKSKVAMLVHNERIVKSGFSRLQRTQHLIKSSTLEEKLLEGSDAQNSRKSSDNEYRDTFDEMHSEDPP